MVVHIVKSWPHFNQTDFNIISIKLSKHAQTEVITDGQTNYYRITENGKAKGLNISYVGGDFLSNGLWYETFVHNIKYRSH